MKLIKINRLGLDAILLLAGLCAVPAAYAGQDSGGYFGATVGQASASDYCSDAGGVAVATCDDKDTSFKVFGGYRFTRNVAVEAAYVDLGKFRASGSFLGSPFDVNTTLTGVTVQGVGIAPFGNEFSLMGRVGAIFWNLKTSGTVGGFPGSTSDNGADLALGVGAQYKFAPSFGVRADLDYYPNLGNSSTGEDNVTSVSIGLVFLF
ncbi:MAG TPA: outer membrane beta-barrel protein [Burkholderiales bacterium]|nr:outer membrane beta-barrel protein [Burkholderiales bacterium]